MSVQIKPRNKNIPPIPFFTKLFGTGFYSGFFPFASGTFASLVALIVFLFSSFHFWYNLLALILMFYWIGVYTARKIERLVGQDPSIVVIDEFVGMWISLFFIPISVMTLIIAFILFRIFDILKPFPANYFNNRTGGNAIMLDDVVAGIYANLILQLLFIFVEI
jgi:phosphatidylglycerophosphatase A